MIAGRRAGSDAGSVLPLVITVLAALLALTLLLSYALQAAVMRLRLGESAQRLAVLEAGAALAGRSTCNFVPPLPGIQLRGCRDDGREIRIEVSQEMGWPYPLPIRAVGRVGYGPNWNPDDP